MVNKTAAVIQKAVARDAAVYANAIKDAFSKDNHLIKSHLKQAFKRRSRKLFLQKTFHH